MRLVYLDTSYLSELTRIRRTQPHRFEEFRDFWIKQELALAFSTTHMRETLRYGARGERFELLRTLLPVVSDLRVEVIDGPHPSNLAEREILRALAEQGRIGLRREDDRERVDRWCAIWPTQCWTNDEAELFSLYDQEAISRVERVVYAAHSTSAKAARRASDKSYERTRLSAMPTEVVPADQAEQARQIMLETLDDPSLWNDFPWDLAGSTPEKAKAEAIANIDRMLEAMTTVGPKSAYLKQLGINNPDQFNRTFTDDLIQQWKFDNAVREVVAKFASGDGQLCDGVIALDLLPSCPGSWLKAKLSVEVSTAVAAPKPNHEYDLEHMGYFPHVDVFLCDGQMARLAAQVLSRTNTPRFLAEKRRPISPALDIDSIRVALESK